MEGFDARAVMAARIARECKPDGERAVDSASLPPPDLALTDDLGAAAPPAAPPGGPSAGPRPSPTPPARLARPA
jgi:hypothetical protein